MLTYLQIQSKLKQFNSKNFMRTSTFLSILFLFNFFQVKSVAQGEAALPFLLLQPSPSLSAMGQTGTVLPTNDPFGFVWNPAQLGLNSQKNNLSFIFYPSKLEWLPVFNLDLELKGSAFNAGYNFKDLIGFPLSFGFGYSNTEINFGEIISRDENGNIIGTSQAKDSYNAYSFGLGMDYYIQLSFGYTIKDVTSNLSNELTAKTTVNDFGILMNVPVIRLIDENLLLPIDDGLKGKPTFNFSLGYSKSNIGDEIYYIDPAQADPLPRMERFGYGVSTGFDLVTDNFSINAFNFLFTVEADDILIDSDQTGWEYQSTLSDFRFWKNIVLAEGDDNIVSHVGLKLEFVETVALAFGHFQGRGSDQIKTSGYEFRAKGLLRLYALWAKDPIADFIRDHIDIRYYNTDFFDGSSFETKITGLAFYIHNLDLLLK